MSLSDAMNYKNDDDDEDFTSIPGSRTANRMANRQSNRPTQDWT